MLLEVFVALSQCWMFLDDLPPSQRKSIQGLLECAEPCKIPCFTGGFATASQGPLLIAGPSCHKVQNSPDSYNPHPQIQPQLKDIRSLALPWVGCVEVGALLGSALGWFQVAWGSRDYICYAAWDDYDRALLA